MLPAKMKKISIVITRRDAESVLREIMLLGCIEVSRPDELPCFAQISDSVSREVYRIDRLGANSGAIVLFGTHYTLMLTGWLPSRSEPLLISMLSKYVCAWEIEDPTPEELDFAPVRLAFPMFFGKLRGGGRRLFKPLAPDPKGKGHGEVRSDDE